MKNALFILYALFLYTTVYGEELNSLYERLDSVLAHRKEYARQKEEKIAAVRQTIKPQTSLEHLFQTYYTLSEEYYTYRSDSALFYIEKAADIAERLDNRHYKDMVQIQKSLLMATTGYFSQALSLLDDINRNTMETAENTSQQPDLRDLEKVYERGLISAGEFEGLVAEKLGKEYRRSDDILAYSGQYVERQNRNTSISYGNVTIEINGFNGDARSLAKEIKRILDRDNANPTFDMVV